MRGMDRRQFVTVLLGGLATPFLLLSGCGGSNGNNNSGNPQPTLDADRPDASLAQPQPSLFKDLTENALHVFSASVASGDPTESGVIVWTRVEPAAWQIDQPLFLEVAQDNAFQRVVLSVQVAAKDITALNDYTVRLDLDGLLAPYTRYYYRFVYGRAASPVGRCRTAPSAGSSVSRLKLAVLTCQDYTNGYYPALSAIAADDAVDFVVHLGDFIYESAGDPRFQTLPFEDRLISLPSVDFPVAMGLEDYRHIYRTYRSDPKLQHCMSQHTWIITRDDHETGNDAYWDYANQTVGLPDHPYTHAAEFAGDRLSLLNQLMLDSQQAWFEYVPARVRYTASSTDPHTRLGYYRHIQLGDLVDLYMLDTRSYRTPHPCGEGELFERYGPLFCQQWYQNQEQSLLGQTQIDWLVAGLASGNGRWQVLGNQTMMSPLWFAQRQGDNAPPATDKAGRWPLNVDAWDGYDAERVRLTHAMAAADARDVVVLTGDLHAATVSTVKKDFLSPDLPPELNVVAKEFMTPAVTSANLMELTARRWAGTAVESFIRGLAGSLTRANNPHIEFFDPTVAGFSVIEFTAEKLNWRTYAVNKRVNDALQQPSLLMHYESQRGAFDIVRVD